MIQKESSVLKEIPFHFNPYNAIKRQQKIATYPSDDFWWFLYCLDNNTSPTKKDTLPPHFSSDLNIPRETGNDSNDLFFKTSKW